MRVGERVVEVDRARASERVAIARVLEDAVERLAPSRARPRASAAAPGVVSTSRIDRRSPATASRATKPALDQTVDDRGDRRLGERQPFGEERRPLVARGDEREHAVLGEGQVAPAARSSERAASARARAARGRSASSTAGKDTEPLEARTIPTAGARDGQNRRR